MVVKKFREFVNESVSTDINSPEFKSWFGDWENDPEHSSKVVDENGVPQVVTHLTREEFDDYDQETADDYFIWGYVPNKEDDRSKTWGDSSIKQLEFYFNLKNPLIIDAEGRDSDDIPGTKWGLPYDHESANGVAMIAKERGYDGVIIKNVLDVTTKPSTDVIAFKNNQIRRIKKRL